MRPEFRRVMKTPATIVRAGVRDQFGNDTAGTPETWYVFVSRKEERLGSRSEDGSIRWGRVQTHALVGEPVDPPLKPGDLITVGSSTYECRSDSVSEAYDENGEVHHIRVNLSSKQI